MTETGRAPRRDFSAAAVRDALLPAAGEISGAARAMLINHGKGTAGGARPAARSDLVRGRSIPGRLVIVRGEPTHGIQSAWVDARECCPVAGPAPVVLPPSPRDAELAPLRQTRHVVAVEPDFSDIEAPANMMDPNLAIRAFQIGKRQGEREAAAIQAAWYF